VAAREPPEREPCPARGAVTLQRFERVRGAGRVETTVHPERGAQGIPIAVDEKRQQAAHWAPTRACSTSARENFPEFTRIRMSRLPRRACCARNSSRSTRFIRLRSTARGKTRLGTMRPNLGTPKALARRSTLKPLRLSAGPLASRAAISVVPSRNLWL